MAAHEAQGQIFKEIGIDLFVPCFSYVQLDIGVSRTGSAKRLSLLTPDNQTRNVVYPEGESQTLNILTVLVHKLHIANCHVYKECFLCWTRGWRFG